MFNKNIMGKLTPISDGKMSLHEAIQGYDQSMPIVVDQVHRSSKGDMKKGKVSMTLTINQKDTKTETSKEAIGTTPKPVEPDKSSETTKNIDKPADPGKL